MNQIYPYYQKNTASTLFTLLFSLLAFTAVSQNCDSLTATYISYESRCAATGSIKIIASGGSGSYKYRVTGPVNTNYTSTDSITGLQAGVYALEVKDIVNNCTFNLAGVNLLGDYQDPRFTPIASDITCEGAQNGSITLGVLENGRGPFTWTIMAPSAMGEGTSNQTGNFNNLKAGEYRIRMTDSCGGIQTRVVRVHDYTWEIDSYSFVKNDCNTANGWIKVTDSKNNISTIGGIPGFMYGVVRQPGDTVWSASASMTVSVPGITSIGIVAKDACGKIKSGSTPISFLPSLGTSVSITNKGCATFTASLTGIKNFFSPSYSLYDSDDVLIATNTSGVFNSIPYGSYCIKALDACTNTTIIRCFAVSAPPLSIGSQVAISNKNCSTFTATITNKVGLTSPTFYLYDNASVLIATNTSGIFNNISYGSYTITTKDGCRDTSINRSFTAKQWKPRIIEEITPSYLTCTKFGIEVGGDSLTTPNYCLYDNSGTLIVCNSTGNFDSLVIGAYTVKIHDACLDTTIIRTFTVNQLDIGNDVSVHTESTGCNLYSATVESNNLGDAVYTLYTAADVIVGSNTTGIFTNIPTGAYYVNARNLCPDTTFRENFSIANPIPSVNANVNQTNFDCGSFTASITGQQNLTTPQYCLYDNSGQLISCNTNGVFASLSFGSYSINITNSCYDTVITRSFVAAAQVLNLTVSSKKSCNYGNSDFTLKLYSGEAPYNVRVYNDKGDELWNNDYSSTTIVLNNIPGIVDGENYKFVATDKCGRKDSVTLAADVSYLKSNFRVKSVCPGDMWTNGSGTIEATILSNMPGAIQVRIFKKNGTTLSPQVNPTYVSGSVYSFDNLEPATYILTWHTQDGCGGAYYDTLTVNPYTYPSLRNSTAYHCDENGITVGAKATEGVSPYTYEIIGSFPDTPTIVKVPQASPLFNITNDVDYSLIRLRALDACGNATLGDVSILPLASNKVTNDKNCFMASITLKVDPVYNSVYTWYKKDSINGMDSTLVSSGAPEMNIPTLLPSDTGIYVCHISIAGGCINRTYTAHIDGGCYKILSTSSLDFTGVYENGISQLNWNIIEQNNVAFYTIERKNGNSEFEPIGKVQFTGKLKYVFNDMQPGQGTNYYRLQLNFVDGTTSYSKIVALGGNENMGAINIFPNPVTDYFTVDFNKASGNYKVILMNLNNQVISQHNYAGGVNNRLVIKRDHQLSDGLYIVRIIKVGSHKEYVRKIIFK